MSKRQRSGGFGGPPGGAPNQAAMLRQIQKMQDDIAATQASLETETIEASVGGGAVKIVITGSQKVQSITINPEVINTSDPEWLGDLQDLLVAAMNQAIEQSQAYTAERMQSVTGGLDSMLPGGLGGLFG
jgi:nucleoid-associated protein EbfC